MNINWRLLLILLSGVGALYWVLHMKDIDNLARTLWGEARGDGVTGMQAVANVVMNRVGAIGKWFSGTVSEVVRKPYQFSAWNANDPNLPQLEAANEKTPGFLDAVAIAVQALKGELPDITGGATHYYAAGTPKPNWVAGATFTTQIGNHLFYKNVA